MNSDLLHGFYLKDLQVNPQKGLITGRIRSAHLPPKAMKVLLCLASNAGGLVTRETLIESVWGAGKGSQERLSHAVGEIRHALGDHSENPEYVQTLPSRGYRLIVPVSSTAEHAPHQGLNSPARAEAVETGLMDNLKQRGVLETALAYLVSASL